MELTPHIEVQHWHLLHVQAKSILEVQKLHSITTLQNGRLKRGVGALTLSRFKSKAAFPVLGLTTAAGFSSTSSPSSPSTSDSSDGKSSATATKRARPLTCRLTLCQVRPPASALPPHCRARPAGKGRTDALFFVEVALAAPRVSDDSAGATSSSMEAAEVLMLR